MERTAKDKQLRGEINPNRPLYFIFIRNLSTVILASRFYMQRTEVTRYLMIVSKTILWSVLGLLTILLLMLATSYVCMKIPVRENQQQVQNRDSIQIFLSASLVHSDFILPIRHEVVDWSVIAKLYQPSENLPAYDHVKIGWGDKEFFVNTPEWSDLTAKTALGSAFGLHESAIHFQFIQMEESPKEVTSIFVSTETYAKLVNYILQSMKAEQGSFSQIHFSYGPNDCFYDSYHHYSMFNTCNTWMNEGLKEAGLPACLWTILGTGIIEKYQAE
ncbi:MAG: DUF2459 domain-containing protein [Flavobacteriales bacterium]